jgi:hypothetical protein
MPANDAAKTLPHVLEALRDLCPQPDRYIFVENNSTDETLGLLWKFPRPKEVIRLWFRPDLLAWSMDPYEGIARVRQVLLNRARHLKVDNAIFLDADVKPLSRNLIERLTAPSDYDILGGPYPDPVNPINYNAVVDGAEIGRPGGAVTCSSGPVFKHWPFLEAIAVGGGCMRISRKLLQDRRVNFHPVYANRGSIAFSESMYITEDYGYCISARDFGYRVALDLTLVLTHQHAMPYRRIDRRPWR